MRNGTTPSCSTIYVCTKLELFYILPGLGVSRSHLINYKIVTARSAFLRETAKAVIGFVFVFLSGIVILLVLFEFFLVSNNTPDFGLVGEGGIAGMLSRTAHERRPLEYVDLKRQEELRFQIQELEEIRASVRNELQITDQSRLSWEVDTQKLALTHRKRPSPS